MAECALGLAAVIMLVTWLVTLWAVLQYRRTVKADERAQTLAHELHSRNGGARMGCPLCIAELELER